MLTQIGSYEILAQLGAGGMSSIYRARDRRLGRVVALKLLSDTLMREPESVERFLREARAASALNHPNIVTIFEAGEIDGQHFIVMELVKGRTLRPMLQDDTRSLDALPGITIQIARALSAAHEAGIVHRDIKPENIMLRDDGYVKVVDFGIARLLPAAAEPGSSLPAVTKTGMFLGTPRYMSPEQIGGETVGSASDIFSLGVVLYEWVTGQHPFPGDSAVRMMYAIMSQPALALSHFNPGVPSRLETLILDMLQKDPAARPGAADLIDRLTESTPLAGAIARPEPRIRAETPTVGRRRERGELRKILDGVTNGRGVLIGVAGEPGIGKTSLVEGVLQDLASDAQPWFFARGRCSERLAGTEAYLPFLEAFDSLIRSPARETVSRLMKALAPSWYLQLSAVTSSTDSAQENRARSQERFKRELVTILMELSAIQPLALLFEDVHWADDSTVDLLSYVSSHFDDLRVAIIATYRPSELQLVGHQFLALRRELEGRALGREISLEFLTCDDIGEYLRLIFPRSRFPDALAALVHAKTEGNPLFMADLVRDLRDRGVIARDGDEWTLAREISDFEREVPASIRSMVQRRIDALDKEDRDFLVVASVQGVRFDTAIVARALDTDPADLEERLDVLERLHFFVRLVGEESLPDGTPSSQYRFVHALYQNGLYDSLRPVRRASLSGTVARVLAAAHEKDVTPVAAELALLFDAARDFTSAARHFLMATAKAADFFADKEAITLARRGLDALRKVPQTQASTQLELELQLALARSLIRTQGYTAPDVERAYVRARELCEHVGDPVRFVVVVHGLWQYYVLKGDLRRATELAEQQLSIATESGDTQLLSIAHRAFGTPYLHGGRFAEAFEHLHRAAILDDAEQAKRVLSLAGPDAGTGTLGTLALGHWLMGNPEQAMAKMIETVDHTRRIKHPYMQTVALAFSTWLHQYRRDPHAARDTAEVMHTLATEREFGLMVAAAAIVRGWTAAEFGDAENGIVEMRKGMSEYERIGAALNMTHYRGMLAEALQRAERWAEALDVVESGLALAEANGERYWKAELLRGKGIVLLALDRDTDAEASVVQAIAVAREQKSRMLELRATVSLTRLWQGQKRQVDGKAVADLYETFTEGFDSVDLREARALLTELATPAVDGETYRDAADSPP